MTRPQGRISRRALIGGAAGLGVAAAAGGAAAIVSSTSSSSAPRRAKRHEVAVLGGGVSGLTAAHELIERGFAVTVYERKALGGKARSIPVPGTSSGGRRDLPGEHGFRFFPGFYTHVPDTMRRIPFGGNPNGVFDNMVVASEFNMSRGGDRHDLILPTSSAPLAPAWAAETIAHMFQQFPEVPPHELAIFVNRLLVFFGSCDERRTGQWEDTSWWAYTRAEQLSKAYQQQIVESLTRNLVVARADLASTMTIGTVGEAFIYNAANKTGTGEVDRVLDGPTNEVWIDPWVAHLRERGVRFVEGWTAARFELGGKRLSGVVAQAGGGSERIDADWFVLAVPPERAAPLMTPDVLAVDPGLAGIATLRTEWMNGIQFFLDREVPVVFGHVSYIDSPWAITSISQAQFWENDIPVTYGDGRVRDILSVDISNWEAEGAFGKPARACTRKEIEADVWEQLKQHLNGPAKAVLTDDMQLVVSLDPAISFPASPPSPGVIVANDEPLLINTVGSWKRRPTAATRIENLFLAGDYVQSDVNLATMESANETARRAVNALLAAAGSAASPAKIFPLYRPPEWEEVKRVDADRFARGLPHALDLPAVVSLPGVGALDDLVKRVLGPP